MYSPQHRVNQHPSCVFNLFFFQVHTLPPLLSQMDDVLGQATAVQRSLVHQRGVVDSIGDKLYNLGSRFPVVNGLLNAIRRRKSRDSLVLGSVIAGCCLFILIYWLNK